MAYEYSDNDEYNESMNNSSSLLEDDGNYIFPIDSRGGFLQITGRDSLKVLTIVGKTGFNNVDINVMIEIFKSNASDETLLTKEGFDKSIREMVPATGLSVSDKENLSKQLSNIFYAFDRAGNDVVDLAELTSGMLLLCDGKKSEKLDVSWELFDTDRDSTLSRRQIWKFLRSFLTVLLVLNEAADQDIADNVYGMIDNGAIEATSLMFNEVATASPNKITFDEFGSWYNENSGSIVLQWLELLDLSKWPEPHENDTDFDDTQEIQEPVFSFLLSSEGDSLNIFDDDIKYISRLVEKSGVHFLNPENIQMLFSKWSNNGNLDESAFHKLMNNIRKVKGKDNDSEDSVFLSLAHAAIFDIFDYHENGNIQAEQLATGISLLSNGRKSEKLIAAFDSFKSSQDSINSTGIFKLLSCFLTMLLALTKKRTGKSSDVSKIVDRTCVQLTRSILKSCMKHTTDGNSISFEEFGEWYNTGGFKEAPWLELLDLEKCFGYSFNYDTDNLVEEESNWNDTTPNSPSSGYSHTSSPIFSFTLTSEGQMLNFYQRDINILVYLVTQSRICDVQISLVHDLFLSQADSNGDLSKDDYEKVIRSLVPSHNIKDTEKLLFSQVFRRVFYSFEPSGRRDHVKAEQLAIGFGALCDGSKSDKLLLTFERLDQDNDGNLDRSQMYIYLSSFLRLLFALSSEAASLRIARANGIIHNATLQVLAHIFHYVEGKFISFEQFADWYSNMGGMQIMPWIELLSLNKWPIAAEEGADSTAGTSQDDSVSYLNKALPLNIEKDNSSSLEINREDIAKMMKIYNYTNFKFTSPDELINDLVSSGLILPNDKLDFNVWKGIITQYSASNMDEETKGIIVSWFDELLYLLCSSSLPGIEDIATAFSVLTNGNKSNKLAISFYWFDDDDDGALDEVQLTRYLKVFLITLMSLSESIPDKIINHIDYAIHFIVQSIFKSSLSPDFVTFEEFSEWYTNGGFKMSSWIELIAINKWLSALPSTSTGGTSLNTTLTEETGKSSTYQPAIFSFQLTVDGESLKLGQSDFELLQYLVSMSQLDRLSAPQVFRHFHSRISPLDGKISKEAFDEVIRGLIVGSSLQKVEQEYLSKILNGLYFAFANESVGVSSFGRQLAVGLTIFCSGNKSEKLSAAFKFFDTKMAGKLSQVQLKNYLNSYLVVFISLNCSAVEDFTSIDVLGLASRATDEICQSIFRSTSKAGSNYITFEQFANWYTQTGFGIAPWLELLDMSKWPKLSDETSLNLSYESNAGDYTSATETSKSNTTGSLPQVIVYSFPLANVSLNITRDDIEMVQTTVNLSQLNLLSPKEFISMFCTHAANNQITYKDYISAIRAIVVGKHLDAESRQFLSAVFDKIYSIFSVFFAGTSPNACRFTDLASGLLLFSKGNKSDKLALAFDLFLLSNSLNNNVIDRRMKQEVLVDFLQSFLLTFIAIKGLSDEDESLEILIVVYEGVTEVVELIWKQVGIPFNQSISYEQFAEWYTNGGHDNMQWLELLDLRKWPITSEYDTSTLNSTQYSTENGSTGEDIIFSVPLTSNGYKLELQTIDGVMIQRLLHGTIFNSKSADEIVNLFLSSAEDNTIDRVAFQDILDQVIRSNIDPSTSSFCSIVLNTVFNGYDILGQDSVNASELAAGFTLFAYGKKSEKLLVTFELFDEDDDSFLDADQLESYFRSVLTILFELNDKALKLKSGTIKDIISNCAAEQAATIFNDLDTDLISFDDFSDWYTNGGFEVMPWVELLDTSKWPFTDNVTDTEFSTEDNTLETLDEDYDDEDDDENEDDEDEEDEDEDEDEDYDNYEEEEEGISTEAKDRSTVRDVDNDSPVMAFNLTSSGQMLEIYTNDIHQLKRILSRSGLNEYPVSNLYEAFINSSNNGVINKSMFDTLIKSLIADHEHLTKEDKTFLSLALSNIFYAFDYKFNGKVDVTEIASGFSLLCSGSKSDKLSIAFNYFDKDDDGYLHIQEMSSFLRSFLTILLALNERASQEEPDTLNDVLSESANEMSQNILSTTSNPSNSLISFDDFSNWYSYSGGSENFPWIELLDTSKWPETEKDIGPLIFAFDLNPGDTPVLLKLHEKHVESYLRILKISQFDQYTAADLANSFCNKSEQGLITKNGFDEVVRTLIDGDKLSSHDKKFLSFIFTRIFLMHYCDKDHNIDVNAIAASFTFFSSGNKSEKLGVAFDLFDDDGDNTIIKAQFKIYIRSFLVVLYVLSEDNDSMELTNDTHYNDILTQTINKIVEDIEIEIHDGNEIDEDTQFLTFDQFSDWYQASGHSLLPWIELLSSLKWPKINNLASNVSNVDYSDEASSSYRAASSSVVDDSVAGQASSASVFTDMAVKSDNTYLTDIVFEFDLANGASPLVIRNFDVLKLNRLLLISNLNNFDVDDLISGLEGYITDSDEPLIDRNVFNSMVNDLISLSRQGLPSLQNSEVHFIQTVFSNIFNAFMVNSNNEDHDDPLVSNARALLIGFSLFCSGSKSVKLISTFDLVTEETIIDEEGEECGTTGINRLSFYLSSYLKVIVALVHQFTSKSSPVLFSLIKTHIESMINEFMAETKMSSDDKISFKQFGDWYSTSGFEFMPWIELLDLKKWKGGQKSEDDDEDDDLDEEEDNLYGDDDEKNGSNASPPDDDNVIFLFELTRSSSDTPSNILTIVEGDVHFLKKILAGTTLHKLKPSLLHEMLLESSDNHGRLSKMAFDECVRKIIPGHYLSMEDKSFLSKALNVIYFTFDIESKSSVKVHDFAAGFSMLAAGNKSEKLLAAWLLINPSGKLNQNEVLRFLSSFLTFLLAINEEACELPGDSLHSIVKSSCSSIITSIFSVSGGEVVTFEEFGNWYTNEGGNELAPWIELLDLTKWPSVSMPSEGYVAPVLEIHGNGESLSIFPEDLDELRKFSISTGLSLVPISQLIECVQKASSNSKEISLAQFVEALETIFIIRGSQFFTRFIQSVYDELKNKNVLIVAFFVLISGSRSNKLESAFKLFASNKTDSNINVSELSQIFTAFNTVLAISSKIHDESDDTLKHIISAASTEMSERVFENFEKQYISFAEFEDWYSKRGGCELLPFLEWLELIAPSKIVNSSNN